MSTTNLDAPPPIAPNPPRHTVRVAGIIRDAEGRVLLVHDPHRGWEGPGGHVELGEDLLNALRREIEEETGTQATVDRLLGIYSSCEPPYALTIIFACTYAGGELCTSEEAPKVAWFPPDVAQTLITPPPHHAPGKDLFALEGAPMYRAYQSGAEVLSHDGGLMLGSGPTLDPDRERLEDHLPRHVVAVTGAVQHPDGSLLVVRSGWRGWEFPGGQVEQGEDLITALRREIEEESGCVVEVGRLLGAYSNVGEPHIVQFLFACKYLSGQLQTSYETPDLAWFTPAEALALPMRTIAHTRVEDALTDESGIAYRVYRTRPAYEALTALRLAGTVSD